MTAEQQAELSRIREEQRALRAAWTSLERRIAALEPLDAPASDAAPMPAPVAITFAASAPKDAESLEMRIGTTWLVRAGIVLLLTSLAFIGNYLYQNVVPHLGPGGKVALLYLGAGLLTLAGAWLERSRQARELNGLQDYARVVLAGGLAAVYYVTYAAHYYPNLRVIESAFVAGLLLLGWAVFLVWLADRRASELLATFAILLAFYTSAINEIATFTLLANLVLATGAVYLLRRHLWRVFPFASLLATFGSYAFWRYFHFYSAWRGFEVQPEALPPASGFWVGSGFLAVYWALFTWAVFTTGERVLSAARRATFISLNNGAFFLLTTWILLAEYPGTFWRWSLLFGLVLLALGEAGRRLQPPLDPASESAYQLPGILLITLGCVDYFSGWQLSLILAVQSRLLVAAAERRRSAVFLGLAGATALLAFICAADELTPVAAAPGSWIAPLAVGALLLEAGWRCERRLEMAAAAAGFFALLGAGLWWWILETEVTSVPAQAPIMALAALVLLGLGYAVRFPGLSFCGQGYLLAAQGWWLLTYGGLRFSLGWGTAWPPWWNITAVLAATLVFGQAWRFAWAAQHAGPAAARFASLSLRVLMALGVLCGWCYVSGHPALFSGGAFNLAARWSLYAAAVFGVGLLLHERVYRWLGLLILVATLGRVVLFDLWQIDLLARALSLLTLGLVLLALGFFYTRYGSKLRDLL